MFSLQALPPLPFLLNSLFPAMELIPLSFLHIFLEFLILFFLFVELIGVILVNKITQVQVHDFTTHHLYTVLCVLHPKLSLGPSPFIPPLLPSPPASRHPPLPGNPLQSVSISSFSFLFCSILSWPTSDP